MISAKPVALVAMLAIAGVAVAQEKADEQRIAELIEQLGDEATREDATVELLKMGSRPTDSLMRAIRQLDSTQDYEWQRAILFVLIMMGKDAATGFFQLGEALAQLPDELGPFGLRTYGELALWAARIEINRISMTGGGVLFLTRDGVGQSVSAKGDPELFKAELIRLLGRLRASRGPSPSAVEAMLNSESPAEIELGLEFVETLGPQAEGWLPRIEAILAEELARNVPYVDLVRFKAARTMLAIAPRDPRSSTAYGYFAAHHYDPEVRARSALAAAALSDQSDSCVRYVIEALSDDNRAVVREVITALGMIGPAAKDAVPTLEKLTEHEDKQIAERAKAALRHMRK